MLKDISGSAGVDLKENDVLKHEIPAFNETSAVPFFRSIPTRFNNVIFRSRLEARWAVFLTELKITWEYEHEGYDLNGTWYLPDFYLPYWNGGTFVEVKPKAFTDLEDNKVKLLCGLSGHPVFKAVGSPDLAFYQIYITQWYQQFKQVDLCYTNFGLNWKSERDHRFWLEYEKNPYILFPTNFPELTAAVQVAKSYRF